jgi:hypothetical protein
MTFDPGSWWDSRSKVTPGTPTETHPPVERPSTFVSVSTAVLVPIDLPAALQLRRLVVAPELA